MCLFLGRTLSYDQKCKEKDLGWHKKNINDLFYVNYDLIHLITFNDALKFHNFPNGIKMLIFPPTYYLVSMKNIVTDKGSRLFILLGGFFITNALVAEFIGVKIFALEDTLGWQPFNWNLFGQEGSLMFSAGVLLWPLVFIMTDVINEYYGQRGVKFLSYLTSALILYAFLMIFMAIDLAPADFWVGINAKLGVPDNQKAFASIFGQSNWIIIGSLIAFLIGQIIDAWVFFRVRLILGEKSIWARATISTIVSQFIDSFVVLYVAFVLGPQQWEIPLFLAVGTVNYAYKVTMAILLIPLLYLAHYLIDKYLGKNKANELRRIAVNSSS